MEIYVHFLLFCCWHVMMSSGTPSAVGVVQYDEKVKRRSLDDPLRHHRRSSIPFVDRKPAVRFIRSIDLRKASVVGPKSPVTNDTSHKPILKKSIFPNVIAKPGEFAAGGGAATTNDELENCKIQTDMIMDKISSAERTARGSMDVLTFPTVTRRIGILSKYQGNMTISLCSIDLLTTSGQYQQVKKDNRIDSELQLIINLAHKTVDQANTFQRTAKKFLRLAKHRYNEWEKLLKKNTEFKIEHSKLRYPIYPHKRMPESVTMYDEEEDLQSHLFSGHVRFYRNYPDKNITLHWDSDDQADLQNPVNFQESPIETQAEIIKFLMNHSADLLVYSDNCLSQGLEILLDREIDEAFETIHRKISNIEYDQTYDPICALELKNSLGELVARKAELLNTAEQIIQQCQHITTLAKMFYQYTKKSVKGGLMNGCISCFGGGTKKKILNHLEAVSTDEISLYLPLTIEMAQDIFHIETFASRSIDEGEHTDTVTVKMENAE